jgi:hypothetical protein
MIRGFKGWLQTYIKFLFHTAEHLKVSEVIDPEIQDSSDEETEFLSYNCFNLLRS